VGLREIASGQCASVELLQIALDSVLVREIQGRLGDLGLLDSPADGMFGPVSRWALEAFYKQKGLTQQTVDRTAAQLLLDANVDSLFPIVTDGSLAGRLLRAMQNAGYRIARHPDAVNIVYVEGMNGNGTKNTNTPNCFNDIRCAVRIAAGGKPILQGVWEATTEPSRFWTLHPIEASGAARIAFGQYKAWSVGTHGSGSQAHEALVQTAEIKVWRDLNKDFRRNGDKEEGGIFAVNQHWGYDMPKNDIGRASAGCLVGRTRSGHRDFLHIVKSDPRFQASSAYRFLTTVFPASAV
jgi:peptidoglycan hydrolase-like protein with peptidoglycan-binding domain